MGTQLLTNGKGRRVSGPGGFIFPRLKRNDTRGKIPNL